MVAGRPLGFMVCWLNMGAGCRHKTDHWERGRWQREFTLEARQAAREELLSLSGGPALAEKERAKADGEGDEPVSLQGLA